MPTTDAAIEWTQEKEEVSHWPSEQASPALADEFEHAKKQLLSLGQDWDGEGSQPYADETLQKAFKFLTMQSDKVYSLCKIYPPTPRIGPGPKGSIDLHWKERKWELLINIPASDAQSAVFYGDDYGSQKIKGSFDPKSVDLGIVAWLLMTH